MAGNDVPLNVLLDRTVQQLEHAEALADKRLELLRDALEFIDGMTLQEAELRMAIEKELDDAKK